MATTKSARKQNIRAATDVDKRLGQSVRDARVAAGLSMDALAREVGVTWQMQQKYEKGANRMSVSRLLDTCRALGVTPAAMLEGL